MNDSMLAKALLLNSYILRDDNIEFITAGDVSEAEMQLIPSPNKLKFYHTLKNCEFRNKHFIPQEKTYWGFYSSSLKEECNERCFIYHDKFLKIHDIVAIELGTMSTLKVGNSYYTFWDKITLVSDLKYTGEDIIVIKNMEDVANDR